MLCGVEILDSFVGVVIRFFNLRMVFFVEFLILLMDFCIL